MLKTYTQAQMLTYWKRHLGMKASSVLTDDHDLTELDLKLLSDIDAWYDDLLAEAPAEKLPVADLSASAAARYISDNAAEIILPEPGMRLVSVKMSDWQAAEVDTYSAYSDMARLQRNRLTRATTDDPVVIRRPGRIEVHGLNTPDMPQVSDKDVTMQSPAPTIRPQVETLEMVIHPPQGTYVLDSTLLRRSRLYIH